MAIPYKRITAALDKSARERLWNAGGMDRSTEGCSPELADLLDSFYGDVDREVGCDVGGGGGSRAKEAVMEREVLIGLAVGRRDEEEKRVVEAVEAAVGRVVINGGEEEKRKVVWWLRRRGFDAGLCRSKPDKKNTTTGANSKTQFPLLSNHVYIDVVTSASTRFIVELNLASEFEIARPTPEYLLLLAALPCVFVGRPERLLNVVRLLCAAAAASLRSRDMHVPPWRRKEYLQAKWLGPYWRNAGTVGVDECGGEEEAAVASCRRVVIGCREGWWCGGPGGERLQRAVVGGEKW